jgi:serine/threonine protein kinase
MSSCGQLVVAIHEAKKAAAGIYSNSTIKDIEQLAAYMFSVLAFSHWGVGQKNGNEPISGLLLYPTAIYRLSIWKPTEADQCPFGLMYKIERTTDPLMMGWVFETYLEKYEADYRRLKRLTLNFTNVNPMLWTPINCNLGMPLRDASKTNLGFLFKSTPEILKHLIQHTPRNLVMHFCVRLEDIAPGEDLIVKYLSALLVVPPKCDNIIQLIIAANTAQLLKRKDAELKRKDAEIAALKAGVPFSSDICPADDDGGSGFGIKHPYLGVIMFDQKHPLIVMRNVGTSIWDEMKDNNLQLKWRNNPQLRRVFAKDIGESALNLVDTLHMCHNDIRPPNIMISANGDSFCLIDFDMSANEVIRTNAPVMKHFDVKSSDSALRMFSVVQIALVVFELDSNPTDDDFLAVCNFWLDAKPGAKKHNPPIFSNWVKSKGPLVEAIFSDVQPTVPMDSKDDFMCIIDSLVK